MKARTILFLAMLAVVLFCTGNYVWGATPESFFEGKYLEHQGTCRLDSKGNLTFDDKLTKKVEACVVGGDPNDADSKTIIIFKDGMPHRVIRFSLKSRKQVTLWANKGM